jgi:hypothetical protein
MWVARLVPAGDFTVTSPISVNLPPATTADFGAKVNCSLGASFPVKALPSGKAWME